MTKRSIYFIDVKNINELKSRYRRLASRHHPDRGGNHGKMSAINTEYQQWLAFFKSGFVVTEQATTAKPRAKGKGKKQGAAGQQRKKPRFEKIKTGDTVFVNGTETEVIEVVDAAFRVVAKGRCRQAWFSRECGTGLYNAALRASWRPNGRHFF